MKTFSEFSLNLFCLLFGFFLGNLFPNLSLDGVQGLTPTTTKNLSEFQDTRIDILLQTFSGTIPGPSQVGLLILLMSELINWMGKLFRGGFAAPKKGVLATQLFPFLNSIKIGLLFGIFVDAFKVGS